ncbi:venom allergen 5-like [Episyrphus balteatus]|uniref:venom allergen 5-like n=1 Tax=Episyrphus balteatus TaxID=286459 RepID=UPI002484F108|nr:venom allergen 5-like [Episyrphus balteatus]
MMQIVVSAIAVFIFIGNTNCYTHWYNESIFTFGGIKQYCAIKCGDEPHTLCQDEDFLGPSYSKCSENFYLFDLKDSNLKDDVLMGLNGLRNRIADKMQVANMIILTWDEELSSMAQIFLSRCKPFAKNSCTNLGKPEFDASEYEPRHYHVAECMAFRKSKFFPYNFFPSILRDWYYEKNMMKRPKLFRSEFNELYGVLNVHNNFTRLANPRLSRVGCGLARYEDGYALLCYFFPYFQSDVRFDRGTPATTCPNLFPLSVHKLQNGIQHVRNYFIC